MKKQLVLVLLLLGLVLSIGAVSAQDPVVIEWWHHSTDEDQAAYWQGLADEFTAMHPNVTFEITILENNAFKERLSTVMQAGDPPDLFQSWGGGVLWKFADNGLTRDISPWLEGEWRDSIASQAALELYGQNGEYYGVPWGWGAVGFFYNKALFEEAGLDREQAPATWDELVEIVGQLKEAGITPIAMGNSEKWPGHFWYIYFALRLGGGDAFLAAYDRSGSFADPAFVEAGEYMQQLAELDAFPEGFEGLSWPEMAAGFGNGGSAMILQGQWLPSTQADNSADGIGVPPEDLGFFPFPMIEGGLGNPDDVLGGGNAIAVGRDAPDEAIEFLKFVTGEEAQRNMYFTPPVNANALDSVEDPIMLTIMDMRDNAPYFQLYYDQFLPPAVGEVVLDATEALLVGAVTPEEAAQMIEDVAAFEL